MLLDGPSVPGLAALPAAAEDRARKLFTGQAAKKATERPAARRRKVDRPDADCGDSLEKLCTMGRHCLITGNITLNIKAEVSIHQPDP
jgi:hypothetical protein